MTKIGFVLFLLCSQAFASDALKIIEIIEDEEILLLASDGFVYELPKEKSIELENAHYALENNLEVELLKPFINLNKVLDKREKIRGLKLLSEQNSDTSIIDNKSDIPTPLDNFQVTTLETEEQGLNLFRKMRRDTRRRSQCYNRAHVWSWELSKRVVNSERVNLGKTWIFFSRQYIKEYKYKWWFHIAPFIKYKNKKDVHVMDRSYNKKPLPLREWTNKFMHNDAKCTEVQYYSDYKNNQASAWCFIINSSMYYWQPFNIKGLETGSAEKKSFIESELRRAYKNGIKRWDGEI